MDKLTTSQREDINSAAAATVQLLAPIAVMLEPVAMKSQGSPQRAFLWGVLGAGTARLSCSEVSTGVTDLYIATEVLRKQ